MAAAQSANSILTSGIFRGTFTDVPNSDLGWILSINMASESDTRYTAQFFGTYNSDGVYFRHRAEGYWGTWKLIQMSSIS